jgi:hypothetical protein
MTEKLTLIELPAEAQRMVPIRQTYEGPLLPFSFTLKLDATIIERKSKRELQKVIGDKALEVAKRLLVVHPSGGRLRISPTGLIIGYEDEHWVVIGAVSASEWFPSSEAN